MTLARLLGAALVICTLPAFTQDQQPQSTRPSAIALQGELGRMSCVRKCQNCRWRVLFFDVSHYKAATPAEPWRLIPDRSADIPSGYNALDPSRLNEYRFDQVKSDPRVDQLKPDTFDEDTTCYAIRSYVVAQDSKGSDSTHPAGYSTCQPSNRYQVKTADMRVVSGDR